MTMDTKMLLAKESSGKDVRYTCSVARIRVLETRFLTKAFLNRMAEAPSYEEAVKILSEHTEYRQDIENIKEKSDFEGIFISQLKRLYALAAELSRDKETTDLFLLKYDIDNLKALLKTAISGGSNELLLVDLGVFGIDALKECISKKDFSILGKKFASVISEINAVKKPEDIEVFLDRFYLTLIREAILKIKSRFLEHIYKSMIDILNIKIFLRKRASHGEDFKAIILEGGYLTVDFFYKMADKQDTLIQKEFSNTAYTALISEMLKPGRDPLSGNLDTLFDDYFIGIIKEARYFHFGIEPLITYILAKEYEIKNLRRILAGKFYGLNENIIKGSLQEAYA